MQHLNRMLELVDQDYTKNAIYAITALTAMMAILIANYYLVEPNNLPEWTIRIQKQCPKKVTPAFNDKYIVDVG